MTLFWEILLIRSVYLQSIKDRRMLWTLEEQGVSSSFKRSPVGWTIYFEIKLALWALQKRWRRSVYPNSFSCHLFLHISCKILQRRGRVQGGLAIALFPFNLTLRILVINDNLSPPYISEITLFWQILLIWYVYIV